MLFERRWYNTDQLEPQAPAGGYPVYPMIYTGRSN